MSRPFIDRWRDMREQCDEALKLLGQLPAAVACMEHDPEFIDNVIAKLSDQLCCLDSNIGEDPPEHRPQAIGRRSAGVPIEGQVLLATDHCSELLAQLDGDENTLETARQVHLALWRIRHELGLVPTDQRRTSDESEGTE